MNKVRAVAENSLNQILDRGINDWAYIKSIIKDDLSKFIFKQTKRKPMILPVIMDL